MSGLGGTERRVARDEEPIAPTRSGALIVSRWRADGSDPDLVARRPGGGSARIIGRRVSTSYPEPPTGTVLYQQGRIVWRTEGTRSWVVARLDDLGIPGLQWVERVPDGRILIAGARTVALLDRDGTVLGRAILARIPRGGSGWVNVWTSPGQDEGSTSFDPATGGLVVVQAMWRDADAGGGKGWEGVYELPIGGTAARLLFGKRLTLAVCAHDSSLSWHGRWLLYRACEGRIVAIDTSGRRAIDLSAAARSMPMPREERGYGLLSAEWASSTSSTNTPRNPRG
jgi:hypothetical protein